MKKISIDKKKLHLVTSLITFWVYEALHSPYQPIGRLNYKDIAKGDWVFEPSSIYGGRRTHKIGWSSIGKIIRIPKDENEAFVIQNLSGKHCKWQNATFYRFPEQVQERLNEVIR